MIPTTATLETLLADRDTLVRAAPVPTAELQRYLSLCLTRLGAADVEEAVERPAVAELVQSIPVFGVANMLAAATAGYGELADTFERKAQTAYAARSLMSRRHGYAWGALADSVPQVVDAWRRVIAYHRARDESGQGTRGLVPEAEAALLLRRRRR